MKSDAILDGGFYHKRMPVLVSESVVGQTLTQQRIVSNKPEHMDLCSGFILHRDHPGMPSSIER